jgi:NitT/TauT family transport system substrate-binding protein
MRKLILLLLPVLFLIPVSACAPPEEASIGMAVEFMDHAACAYIAQDMGWYEDEGLNVTAYESHVTGMELAAALARDDIQVAYLCLVPTINVYANGGVPIKIVAGTHNYGYGLVVNPDKIKTVYDLENPDIRIGCVREGGAVDVLMHRAIDKYGLDETAIIANIQRMSPPQIVWSVGLGQLDAAFLPEQWATMTEDYGFEMLLTSQEIWPNMPGSMLVVKQDLIDNHPEIVRKLVSISQQATDWINEHPEEAAEIVARQMQASGSQTNAAEVVAELEITPEAMLRSMERLEYTTEINVEMVQEVIDYVASLGYINESFDASQILDLRFLDVE